MTPDIRAMVVTTLTNPAQAAREVLALNLPMNVGWMALVAVSAINAAIYGITDFFIPEPPDGMVLFRLSPVVYFLLLVPALSIAVFALFWVGRALGGTGDVQQMLALTAWLQFVRAVAQVLALVLQAIFPVMAVLFALGIMIWGTWIAANFVNEGHQLGSPLKAFGVIIGAGIGVILTLSVLITLFIGPTMGGANV